MSTTELGTPVRGLASATGWAIEFHRRVKQFVLQGKKVEQDVRLYCGRRFRRRPDSVGDSADASVVQPFC